MVTRTPPRVSLVVPTYRRAAHLRQTIDSALAQTMTDLEIIVVDDCSPDDTAEVMAGFTDPRVRYFRNTENLGVPRNYNHGLAKARGAFVVLLGDHDLMDPTYLEETLAIADRYPHVGFVATGLRVIDDDNHPKELYVSRLATVTPGRKLLRRLLTRTTCPFPVTTLVRRSAAQGIEPLFDPDDWWYADQGLWIRLAAQSDFGYVAKPLLRFRTRESEHQLHGRDWESALCLNRIHRKHWRLLHPHAGWRSRFDSLCYDIAKLRRVAMWRGGRKLRGESWTAEDERYASDLLSGPSRTALKVIGAVPLWIATAFRRIWRWQLSRHYEGTA